MISIFIRGAHIMKAKFFSLFTSLGFLFFSLPTFAMENPVEQDKRTSFSTKPITSSFVYDLSKLKKASKVVAQADFLTDRARSFFEESTQCCNRSQFTQYLLDPITRKAFLSKTDPNIQELLDFHSNPEPSNSDSANYPAVIKILEDELERRYKPYFDNVSYDIQVNGPFNTNLFDSFFYHLLGVGESEVDQKPYALEDVKNLFVQLKKIGFLKNFNDGVEIYTKEIYDPLKKLRSFNEARKEGITDLVIAEGHRGPSKMSSITLYQNNTLTLDISSLCVPDVITDINNEEILKELVACYKGRLDTIYDTSNIPNLTTLETNGYLVQLLKPAGRLMFRFFGELQTIPEDTVKSFVEKYHLKPIYSQKFPSSVIALEK